MQNVKLPDGTWVTTPIAVGIGSISTPCEGDCRWEDFGPITEEVPRVQMQRCLGCGRVRGHYLDDPSLVEDV
jgi:hypothetical protein